MVIHFVSIPAFSSTVVVYAAIASGSIVTIGRFVQV
jgi:hypothetical protein